MPKEHYVDLNKEHDYLESKLTPVRNQISDTLSEQNVKSDYGRVVANAIKLQERWVHKAFLEKPHITVEEFEEKCEKLYKLFKFHKESSTESLDEIRESYKHFVRENLMNEDMDASPEERVENIKQTLKNNLVLDEEIDFVERKLDKLIKQNLATECMKDIYDSYDTADKVFDYVKS